MKTNPNKSKLASYEGNVCGNLLVTKDEKTRGLSPISATKAELNENTKILPKKRTNQQTSRSSLQNSQSQNVLCPLSRDKSQIIVELNTTNNPDII